MLEANLDTIFLTCSSVNNLDFLLTAVIELEFKKCKYRRENTHLGVSLQSPLWLHRLALNRKQIGKFRLSVGLPCSSKIFSVATAERKTSDSQVQLSKSEFVLSVIEGVARRPDKDVNRILYECFGLHKFVRRVGVTAKRKYTVTSRTMGQCK